MKTVIIIPTYNERNNIGRLLETIFALLPGIFILVVDDNSPDKTQEVVKSLKAKYNNLSLLVRQKKEGLGPAYIDAFRRVIQDVSVDKIIMMDADFSHDPQYLPEFLSASMVSDVVIGSRYIGGGGIVGWELWRRLLSRFGNSYARLITGLPVRDLTSGFNLIKADFLRQIDWNQLDMSGYAFIMELKFFLHQAGAEFKEVPIIFKNRLAGESKISSHIVREGIVAPWKIRTRMS